MFICTYVCLMNMCFDDNFILKCFPTSFRYGSSLGDSQLYGYIKFSFNYLVCHIWSIHFSIASHMMYEYVSWWSFHSKLFFHKFHNMVLQLDECLSVRMCALWICVLMIILFWNAFPQVLHCITYDVWTCVLIHMRSYAYFIAKYLSTTFTIWN